MAQNNGSLLGGEFGQTLGNLIEGVFSSSDISISDMTGEWVSTGPAVCFQGEGFLKKAGGAAAAAAIETKLSPYYEQYGLNNASLTIKEDGTFTLTCKAIRLNGTITQAEGAEKGIFEFNFTAFNMKIASLTTYVSKTSHSMDVMFDATKFKKLLSALSQFTGIKVVKALSQLLDSYDGLCVGFHLTAAGTDGSSGSGVTGTDNGNNGNTTNTGSSNGNTGISTGLEMLRGILGGKK